MKKIKRKLKRQVILVLLTLIATVLFAGPVLLYAYDQRGYTAVGGEWLLIIGYMVFMWQMIQYSIGSEVMPRDYLVPTSKRGT